MFSNEQASEMVLSWCRRERHDGAKPAMRNGDGLCWVIDVSYIDTSNTNAIMAVGTDWSIVASLLGVYGPQWEPTPVKRAEPAPHYGYRHRPISRRYGRR